MSQHMAAGEVVVRSLIAEGVKHVFGIVGSTFLPVLDSMYDRDEIQYISVRHEQAAGFMADGFARATGTPAVCLVTGGPGAMNLLSGLCSTRAAQSPVIALAGVSSSANTDRKAFQEFDLISIFRPMVKEALQLTSPILISEMMRYVFRTALTGNKGAVFLEMPRDYLEASVEYEPFDSSVSEKIPCVPYPNPQDITRATSLIEEAERPLIIAGGGVTAANASEDVVKLAEMLNIPIVTAYGRNDAVPNNSKHYVGPLGRAGSPEAGQLCSESDLILAIGTRLWHFTTFYDDRYLKKNVKIIQVNTDSSEIGRHYPVELGITSDAKMTVQALLTSLTNQSVTKKEANWALRTKELRQQRMNRLEKEASPGTSSLLPQQVYAELRKSLPPQTIVTLDAGACPAFAYDRLHFNAGRTFFSPLDAGVLGFAFPEAIGAKLGRPEAPVLAIHGDGGFLFNSQELETAVREKIPVVTLVMNNGSWGSEKAYQRKDYGDRFVGIDLVNPRFDEYAKLFGANGYFIDKAADIPECLSLAFKSELPTVIEIKVDPDEFPAPVNIFKEKVK